MLYEVNDVSTAEGIIYCVKVVTFGCRNIDANAHINVGTTNFD